MFVFLYLSLSKISPQTISVDVTAPWKEPHLFDQMLFFFNDRQPNKISNFILQSTENGKLADEEHLYEIANKLLGNNDFAHLKTFIQIGFYLPRSVTFKEISNSEESLFVTGVKPSFDIQAQFLPNENIQTYPYDIMFGYSKTVIYCDFTNEAAISSVRELVQNKKASFVLRPISKTDSKSTKLSGFSAKIQRVDPFINTTDEFTEYNLSNIPDFDLKFTQYILDSHKKLPQAIRDVVDNWPKVLPEIENTIPSIEANKSLSTIRNLLKESRTTSTLNGRIMKLDVLDAFTLASILNEEINVQKLIMHDFGLNTTMAEKLMSVTMEDKNNYILDFRNEHVKYLNDIETDPNTASWTTTLQELIMPKEGQIPKVRKNLLNLIHYTNPATYYGLTQLFTCVQLSQVGLPLRIGIVPNFNLANKLQRRVAFAFHHLASVNEKAAILFLCEAFRKAGFNKTTQKLNHITEQIYADAYKQFSGKLSCLPWDELYTLYTPLSPEYQAIKNTNKYYETSKVPFGYVTCNGRAITNFNLNLENLMRQVSEMLNSVREVCILNQVMDLRTVDIVSLLANKYTIVQSLDHPVFDHKTVGTGITEMSYQTMSSFVDFLRDTIWQNNRNAKNYAILLCNETTDTDLFERVFSSTNKVAFAINPPIKGRAQELFNYDRSVPTIIANGRVFVNANLTDRDELTDIFEWCIHFSPRYAALLNNEEEKFVAISTMTTIAADWSSRDIIRMMVPSVAFAGASDLMHYEQSKELLNWDIFVDPTSEDYQRNADLIAYCSQNSITNVNLLVVPPQNIIPKNFDTIKTYYRTVLSGSKATFKFLDSSAKYRFDIEAPFTWDVEREKQEFDPTLFTVDPVVDGDKKISYTLSGIVTECVSKDKSQTAFHVDFEAVQNGKVLPYTILSSNRGQFSVTTQPGVFDLKLIEERAGKVYTLPETTLETSTFANNRRIVQLSRHSETNVTELPFERTQQDDFLNVFTVTSGTNSERLAKSMMLSVRATTQSPLRFWFIKEDLTPEFKKVLPTFAKENNFEYQLTSVVWPENIKKPFDFSAVVALKRLFFLDSIFPHDIDKIVFVDVDQIVHEDLKKFVIDEITEKPFALPRFAPFKAGESLDVHSLVYKEVSENNLDTILSTSIFAANLNKMKQMQTLDAFKIQYNSFYLTLTSPDFDLLNMLASAINGTTPLSHKLSCYAISEENPDVETLSTGRCVTPADIAEIEDFSINAQPDWEKYDKIAQKY